MIKLHDGDLSDSSGLIRLVGEIRPDEIYNLAAQSHVQVSFDAPEYSGDVDALGVLRVLEAVRVCGLTKTCKVYQASTSELYGKVEEVPQKETTPFHPYSPYAVAKQYGFWMVKEYRDAYGMFAVNGILFNHESERRGENFVTRKITLAAGRIAEGLQDHLELGNMDSLRDWGYAKDYVECMWLIMQQEKPEDFVIATGVQHTVRDFTEKAFAANGMTIRWEGTGIDEKSQSVLFGENVNKNVAIVYSPLNGTGLKPVTRTLQEMGYTNITVVKEQEQPDGHFPTCPYPNPEIKEAMALGMEYARKCNADLLLATDPDCDRVGIAVKNKAGEYELLTGNQTGMLLLDYICSQRIKHGKMPADPVMIKTIVTMDMGEQIAAHYGLRTVNVLTGFKFIGEQIGKLEQLGKADSYVFGFEESYGYLTGSYVRDKDGVDGAYMICEMFSYYATQGISLLDRLDELYKTYGYCLNTLHSYEFDGSAGFARMQSIMQAFRGGIKEFGGKKVVRLLDYVQGLDGLPKSDVLKFLLEDNCSLVVRPSGTEPKLKIYISVSAENKEMAEEVEDEIAKTAEKWMC